MASEAHTVNGGAGAGAPADPGAADNGPSGAADRLLSAHKEATDAPVKRGRGRPPGSKSHAGSGAAVSAPTAPPNYLPPATSLAEVMASGTGLWYSLCASLYDDEGWLVTDTVKKEMGNVLSWMLADDFYRLGGVGKYVTGTLLFMGVMAIQAQKTAPTRRARRLEAQRRLNQGQPGQRPANPAAGYPGQPAAGGMNEQTMEQRTMAGFMAGPPKNPPTVSS